MNNFNIISHNGVGDLKFGMKRSDAHRILGLPKSSEADINSNECTDYWCDNGLHLNFYGDELIEISMYSNLRNVKFRGMDLFENSGIDVMKFLQNLDSTFFEGVGIYTFPGLGIAVTGFLDENGYRSVTAFKPGLEDLK